jgi:LacI family transcriptional regulator
MMPNSNRPRVSIRSIAAKLSVSHTAVSLALRGSPEVSAKFRALVENTAQEMGYRPDPMLSALGNYRRNRAESKPAVGIAWINAWEKPEDLRSYREFERYWKGAEQAAKEFGYQLEEFHVDKNVSPKELHELLQARAICGILLPPHTDPPHWAAFPWEQYSVVRYGRSIPDPPFHVVTADQVFNTMLSFNTIRERGYERIGYVDSQVTKAQPPHLFRAGFLKAQRNLDETLRVPILNLKLANSPTPHKDLAQWVKDYRIDAILTFLPELPDLLRKAGLRVPEDVALAGTSILDTSISAGINQHAEEIGRVGFLILNSLINDRDTGIPTIHRESLIEGSWIDGASLPYRKPSPLVNGAVSAGCRLKTSAAVASARC